MELNDKVRAWYDLRESGQLSKSYPFQSALGTSQLLYSKKSSDILEANLIEFCRSIPKTNTLKPNILKTRMSYDKSSTIKCSGNSFRLSDGIALADDLYASNEALSKRMLSAQHEEMERFKSAMMDEQRKLMEESRKLPSPAPEIVVPSHSNKFRSAKDQFTSEGGQLKENTENLTQTAGMKRAFSNNNSNTVLGTKKNSNNNKEELSPLPPELEGYDRELVERIIADIIDSGHPVRFEDISGLEFAKKCVTELICWPMTRPDLFKGLRALPRGLLLFGPPGTGKTLIGKAIAHQSGATFFSISASSLMSKWIGEGEKTVRTLFAVAAYRQPAVVFIDEVDSLLCQRSSEENEATRRIKTEFMVQLDGAGTSQTARVVIVGATNRPEELDEAVRRRFVKRLYIPLPDPESRRQLLRMLLGEVVHALQGGDIEDMVAKTEGYSGADIRSLCQEAAMGPVREAALSSSGDLHSIDAHSMPAVSLQHFTEALETVLPSVSNKDLHRYIEWNNEFGSFRRMS